MEKENYEAPSLVELGQFGDDTGKDGIKNNDEIWGPFDEWHWF